MLGGSDVLWDLDGVGGDEGGGKQHCADEGGEELHSGREVEKDRRVCVLKIDLTEECGMRRLI